eukprot:TRINITY_DN3013_c0_g1_i3.p1 TRINITY_DN3013_c0_g1~~TRINITY_DN3013_c0_g1_i3.p1  ORF type:complete len:470 (-),score=57.50 TRINITY_DN3013_c0_g1_i3:134-1543(-)
MEKASNGPTAEEDTPLLNSNLPAEKPVSYLATLQLAMASGAGLLADGYDLSVINIVLVLLAELYPSMNHVASQGLVVSITMIGVIIGMLCFGTVADIIGRKYASIATASLTVVGAVLSSLVTDAPGFIPIAQQLACCRFILGMGIGGEYPLSSAIASEVSFKKSTALSCSRYSLLVFNMAFFCIGSVVQATFVLMLLGTKMKFDLVWRIALVGGALPSSVVLLLRCMMEEPNPSESFRHRHSSHLGKIIEEISPKKNILISACLSWGIYNLVAYVFLSFSHVLCEAVLGMEGKGGTSLKDKHLIVRDVYYSLFFGVVQILGYMGLVLIKRPSNRSLQLAGFFGAAFFLALLGREMGKDGTLWIDVLAQIAVAICLSMLAASTYLVPTENFEPSARGTCVGISAASGKLGAFIGTAFFPSAQAAYGVESCLYVGGITMLVGGVITFFLTPEDKPATKSEKNALETAFKQP